ncbi:hypothetical protein F511_39355 [Dorcoceras hygrometricum]|uniref:Uncharacterized protein n=1 Tax=Dorcoceras hygrometricum TaxID=472368 RepID=A0A2Z7AH29_9LAMI|nr:hypothetical protein F511_39355 [Dorcoceras hygrometricum]
MQIEQVINAMLCMRTGSSKDCAQLNTRTTSGHTESCIKQHADRTSYKCDAMHENRELKGLCTAEYQNYEWSPNV